MKKITVFIFSFLLFINFCFSQSSEYLEFMNKAEKYELDMKWCHALEMYYEALGTQDSPELKHGAYVKYTELRDVIEQGNPGKGSYNDFALHDSWKTLLMDAEIVFSSFCKYEELEVADFKKEKLDYTKRTATYSVKIESKVSNKYSQLLNVIKTGYKNAYKNDWLMDLPKPGDWPETPVSYKNDGKYNINGALVVSFEHQKNYRLLESETEETFYNVFKTPYFFTVYINSYGDSCGTYLPSLYDCKFNLVDENGVEIVKGKRWLIDSGDFLIEDVDEKYMELYDSGKLKLNLQQLYIEYGKTREDEFDSKNKRAFVKNLPEEKLSVEDILVKKKGESISYGKTLQFQKAMEYWLNQDSLL